MIVRLLKAADVTIFLSVIISFPQLSGARCEENCVNAEQ